MSFLKQTKLLSVNLQYIVNVVVFGFVLLSCKQNDSNALKHCKVERKDFINAVSVPGTFESEKVVTVNAPRIRHSSEFTIIELVGEGTYVKAGDTVCVLQSKEIENQYLLALKELDIAKSEYNRIKQDLRLQYLMLESQVQSIETTTQIKQLDSIQRSFSTELDKEIIDLEIERANLQKYKLEAKLNYLKKINGAVLKKMKLKIHQAENKIKHARSNLSKLYLTTRKDGLVQLEQNRTTNAKYAEGDKVRGRRPILKLPNLNKMQVLVTANEAYYKRIKRGQKVYLGVDAHPELKCTGSIKRKAPVGKPISRNSPLKVFDVYVKLDTINKKFIPGLSVSCQIMLDELKDTLVAPAMAIYNKDSVRFAYLKRGDKYYKSEVSIAKESKNEYVISGGLKEGDIITLNWKPKKSIEENFGR